jgi:hypothetical protein
MLSRIFRVLLCGPLLASLSHGRDYVAYSLHAAQSSLISGKREAAVTELAGITRLAGMVIDSAGKDVILVGEREAGVKPLELDDLVVGMRALMVHKEWPLVSLDNTSETKTTRKQKVRFEGSIGNSTLGKSLLDADVILKELALGKRSGAVWGVKSYAALCDEAASRGDKSSASVLFWFFPVDSRLVEREGVFVVGGLAVGTKTQLIVPEGGIPAQSSTKDPMGDRFAQDMTTAFADLAIQFPELRRIGQLYTAVALAHGLREAKDLPDLRYFLKDYAVKTIETASEMQVLTAAGEEMNLTGGVELRALLLRLQDGDVTALREAVLRSRPKGSPLSWPLPLSNWQISGVSDSGLATAEKQSSGQAANFEGVGVSINRQFGSLASLASWAIPSPPRFQDLSSITRVASLPRYIETPNVGGVLLNDVARVEGEIGAGATLGKGSFSVVVDGRDRGIDQIAYKRLVTALWAVYFGREDPGISIDPIARGAERQRVRYIGNVQNLDLGRVMRDADYLMKKWAVGTEQPSIATFKTPDDYANELQTLYLGSMSRFWFVPENMKFKVTPDALLFDSGSMTVKTEFLMSNAEGRSADPGNERFAQWFTENYHGEVIKRYPIYQQLYDYAKLVALAKYLKESGVPLYWFLMANKELVLTEDAPGSVPSLFKDSKHFQDVKIEGGVNLVQKDVKAKGYIFDGATKEAIRVAYMKSVAERGTASTVPERPKYVAQPVSLELGTNTYTAIPQHSSSSAKDRRGIRYQTDISLRTEGYEITPRVLAALQPAIRQRHVWNDLRDKIDGLMKGKSESAFEAAFENALQAAQAKTGEALRKLALLQGKFYPTEPEFAKDAAFALEDKDQFELLGDILVSYAKYYTSLDLVRVFDPNRVNQPGDFGDGWRLLVPYRLRPASKTAAKGYRLPSKMEVVNLITDRREVLDFAETNQMIGYFPGTNSPSEFIGLFVLNDASFRLLDRIGCEFQFNHDLNLTQMLFTEDHNISVEYLEKTGTAFETPPYRIVPENPQDRVDFQNVTLPKRMKVTDAFGANQILEFKEKESPVGWYPPKAQTNRFKALALMTDASYVLADAKGNEFSFDGGGHFTEVVISQDEPIVRSLKMGKNRISFRYRLDPTGNIVIAKAWVGQDEIGAKPLYVVNYDYDSTGRLANRQLLFASGKPIFGQ